jgi:hypothetical protein
MNDKSKEFRLSYASFDGGRTEPNPSPDRRATQELHCTNHSFC